MNQKLERIAAKISRVKLASEEYEQKLDQFIGRLGDIDKSLGGILNDASNPESKAIIMGLHQDLFQLISDFRAHVRKLKFMGRPSQKESS